MSKRKKLQELTIRDNFMFGAVMVDEELCRELLELILGFQIAKVTVSREKSFIFHPEYRGIRLDVIASDEKRTHYDVEMQIQRKKNLGKRSRYYHSQIDMELLAVGVDYEQLPNSYVIFICDFDSFYRQKYKYTFKMFCQEEPELQLDDGGQTIFLSTRGKNAEEVPEGLVKFLEYVKAGYEDSIKESPDPFVRKLQEAVQNVKVNCELEERYMLLEELIKEERAEGKAEGIAEGMTEGLTLSVLSLLSKFGHLPEAVYTRIRDESDQEVLLSYLKKAASAKTMEEFLESMEQHTLN